MKDQSRNTAAITLLWLYLLIVALYQTLIYVTSISFGDRLAWLVYIDPRIGLFFLNTLISGREVFPNVLSWISVGILFVFSVMLMKRSSVAHVYMIAEVLMTTPTLLFVIFVILSNFSAGHGFGINELLLPSCATIVCNLIPLYIAARVVRSLRLPSGQ